ncbi:UTP--glucose-1-phosphate uridylyltransferase [Alteribacter populi]|uniref:UTP--glucose-1-phosphate uridylyltransferase n=1 Tax=Alteribacter populi TaxID=2011011 RepID=UPI000BBA9101|nr:UTP--glucose-1-phosphate uridylyltransferase [Alteribacter populi]
MKVRKAIIPAAGYGTRSLPITKVLPKEMFPIAGKPAIHYIVEEAVAAGIEEVLIIVSRNKNMILDYFDRSIELEAFLASKSKEHLLEKTRLPKVHIQYMRQPYARGLGDAVLLGERFVHDEPFAVLLPDDFYVASEKGALQQLLESFAKSSKSTVAVQAMPVDHLHLYGVIKKEANAKSLHKITDIVEKPSTSPPSNLAVCGRYVFQPDLFQYLKKAPLGVGDEVQLTDAMKEMVKDFEYNALEIDGERYDLGKDEEYYRLIEYFLKNKP